MFHRFGKARGADSPGQGNLLDDRSIISYMPRMSTEKKSAVTRARILTTGRELVLAHGFGGVGLKELLERSGVPKGSFYYYFSSKEAFGCALLEDYIDSYLQRFDALVGEPGSGGDRLMRYFSAWIADDCADSIADRCLVVKLAAEISDLSEDMRQVLDAGVAQLVARLSQLLREGVADGSVRLQPDPDAAAGVLYSQWLGAAILAKLSKNRTPLHAALADTRQRLLP